MDLIVLIFELILLPFPQAFTRKTRHLAYGYIVKRKALSTNKRLYVNSFSTVTKKTILGENVNFNGMKITGKGEIRIGNYFHSGKNCLIITSFHNYNGSKLPYDTTTIDKNVIIEDCVWIGDNVTILGGSTIGEGAIIQAGSVVTKSIPPLCIAGGHPAEVFKKRDSEHFYNLKKNKQFF